MKLFIDESGSITTSRTLPNRYFVIGFLETEYPYNMIRQFKAAKKDYITRTPDSRLDIKAEIKGSEMPFGMKKLIFERITEKTDAVFHYIIIDNFNLYESIATHSALSFNYFVYLTVAQIKNNKRKSNEKLYLDIDDRNTALRSLNSLEDYLKIKGAYLIDKKLVENKNLIVMHPLPRIDEISTDIDNTKYNKYFEQAYNAIPVRMAILKNIIQNNVKK